MSILYGGVNYSIPGDGGPDCYNYISMWQRVIETVLFVPVAVYSICVCAPLVDVLTHQPAPEVSVRQQRTRRYVLALVCTVLGAEIGYKMASRTVIYLLNPCHLATAMQIYLLLSEPTGWATCWLFRLHLYVLCGATLALVFPVVNTRLLPYEVFTYYVQHILILSVPMYMVTFKGAFSAEPLNDIFWPTMSCATILLYHYLPLQILGLTTQVNLNNMLCPAVSDPFRGPYWRPITVAHQLLFIPLHAKVYGMLTRNLLLLLKPYRTYQEPTPPVSPDKIKQHTNNCSPTHNVENNHTVGNGSCSKEE